MGGPKPFGPRSALFSDSRRREVEPLISLLQAIGKERQKTPAQVCCWFGALFQTSALLAQVAYVSECGNRGVANAG